MSGFQINMKNINKMTNIKYTGLGVFIAVFLSACATSPEKKYGPNKSYLESNAQQVTASEETPEKISANKAQKTDKTMQYLSPFSKVDQNKTVTIDLTHKFSDKKVVKLTAEELPLKDYLHYVLGELLGVSYILDEDIKSDKQNVTLNLQQELSHRKLFTISEGLLLERGYVIRFDDGIYYIHSAENSTNGDIAYGYGNKVTDVPNTTLDIMQMVPFDYDFKSQLSLVLQSLAQVQVSSAASLNAFVLRGKRREIIKAIEFIDLMDQPSYRNREIGLYKATYVSTIEIKMQLPKLLAQEGLSLATGADTSRAISMVELGRANTLVFFAPNADVLQRVNFWLQQIDQPASGDAQQYFLYSPQFSRATDLGESLNTLIGGGSSNGSQQLSNTTSAEQQNNKSTSGSNKSAKGSLSASNDKMSMVVDERANVLIFHTSGEEYRKLIPLIKQLDIMPKQVILEVVIAEVTLTDEFKQGVEFALNKGKYGLSTTGAFMGKGFGGLSYLLKGSLGELAINLLQTNSLVNIVSRPSIVVRDGVTANINVGTDIPVIGETASDPLNPVGSKQTTKVEYRKTGIQLSVLPTVNAQGVVSMVIKQKISNQVDAGATSAISPSIFERTINTEVIAASGQTIMLGGLISENTSNKDSEVPFFSKLPLLGRLFEAETENNTKTELVVLVTPRIIESAAEWQDIKNQFSQSLSGLLIQK